MENIGRHITAKFDVVEELIGKIPPQEGMMHHADADTHHADAVGVNHADAAGSMVHNHTEAAGNMVHNHTEAAGTDYVSSIITDCLSPGICDVAGGVGCARDTVYDSYSDASAQDILRVELQALRTRYAICTSHVYLQSATGEIGRQSAREQFQQIVASENFLGELDRLLDRAKELLDISDEDLQPKTNTRGKTGGRKTSAQTGSRGKPALNQSRRELIRDVKTLLKQYSGHEVDCAAKTVELSGQMHGQQYNKCDDCNVEMTVDAGTSELSCAKCGKVRELIGTVFDDAQFYNQEGQKAKSGSFNPNRHYHYWMDHILAREPEEELGDKDDPDNTCGDKVIAQLSRIITRAKKILRLITVDHTRSMLKEIERTDLNKNVPQIMRRLTGVGPPQIPEDICQQVEKFFSKAIEIGERVRPAGRTNRNYYPYYIYKILDSILPADSPYRRVFYYIYLQGEDTLVKNDQEWKVICDELDGIDWKPTNRAMAEKYAPL